MRVVLVALTGNSVIALAKFAAFAVSGSSAMLTEAIHSVVDSVDQVLLLVGEARSRKPANAAHPLGYGMEAYFWSFVVALMVLLLGGVASLYQGVRHILAPDPVVAPGLNFAVLALAAVFEGVSFATGYREFKRVVRGRDTRLWAFIRLSKDPSLYASLLEDLAALVGIAFAAAGIAGAAILHVPWADGAASVCIGLLMTGVAAVLANETRSLIAGEAVSPVVLARLHEVLNRDRRVAEIREIATLHLGPRAVLVALTLEFQSNLSVADLSVAIADITVAMQDADGRVASVYVRPTRTQTLRARESDERADAPLAESRAPT